MVQGQEVFFWGGDQPLPDKQGRPKPSQPKCAVSYPLFSFFSYSCALFCAFLHSQKSQLFSFHAIAHSLTKKTPGVRVSQFDRFQARNSAKWSALPLFRIR